MKRNPELKTPWHVSGLLHTPGKPNIDSTGQRSYPDVREWRDNEPFEATLVFRGTERGRSAAFFRWQVVGGDLQTGLFLPMFISDVGYMIMQGTHFQQKGVITGRWFVVKRGQNYGIRLDDPTEATDGPTGALAGAAGS